ncbi:uncharacterized protein [Malus domestica]|uniref:uncharacterized protein n=1 Tax=Malus domestica TaxID=3750 RepID=UPI0010AA066E|nr:uncharacterized protein LOC114822327 [Malus domestica]
MRRPLPAFLLFACASLFLVAFFSLHLSRTTDLINHLPISLADDRHHSILAVRDQPLPTTQRTCHDVSCVANTSSTVSGLLPAWEVLLIVSPETPLPFASSDTYGSDKDTLVPIPNSPELIWWDFMVYESFSTEDDVVLFTKVLDNRQGINRPPTEFRCMFGDTNDKSNAVRTAVMSSVQEVFRCHHPNVTAVNSNIKFSLEIVDANVVVPPVAYYSPRSPLAEIF